MLRRERLSEYEDKLRAAANSNDFQSTLDAYQLSQAKVDKEMEKQRQLQLEALDRDLKARRAKVRAKADAKKNERLQNLDDKLKENIKDELLEQEQLRKQLEMDEGKGTTIEEQIDKIAEQV